MAKQIFFVLPDDVKFQAALYGLSTAAGCSMPAFVTASYVDVGTPHIRDIAPGSLLVIVNGAIDPGRDLAPIGWAPCCGDPTHGSLPVHAYGFKYLDLDPGDVDRAIDDGLWAIWFPTVVDDLKVLLQLD